jgi:hypothetical protein
MTPIDYVKFSNDGKRMLILNCFECFDISTTNPNDRRGMGNKLLEAEFFKDYNNLYSPYRAFTCENDFYFKNLVVLQDEYFIHGRGLEDSILVYNTKTKEKSVKNLKFLTKVEKIRISEDFIVVLTNNKLVKVYSKSWEFLYDIEIDFEFTFNMIITFITNNTLIISSNIREFMVYDLLNRKQLGNYSIKGFIREIVVDNDFLILWDGGYLFLLYDFQFIDFLNIDDIKAFDCYNHLLFCSYKNYINKFIHFDTHKLLMLICEFTREKLLEASVFQDVFDYMFNSEIFPKIEKV